MQPGFGRQQSDSTSVLLVVYAPELGVDDTMVMHLWDDLVYEAIQSDLGRRLLKEPNRGGKYVFRLDNIDAVSRFTIGLDNERKGGILMPILERYLIEPGDSVTVYIERFEIASPATTVLDSGKEFKRNAWTCEFVGTGAEKYNCRFRIDQVLVPRKKSVTHAKSRRPVRRSYIDVLRSNLEAIDRRYREACRILEDSEYAIDGTVIRLLHADLIGKIEYQKIRPLYLNSLGIIEPLEKSQGHEDTIRMLYSQFFGKVPLEEDSLMHIMAKSPYYVGYLELKYSMDKTMESDDQGISASAYFRYIQEHAPPQLRDRVLTYYLVYRGAASGDKDLEGLIADLYRDTDDQTCKNILRVLLARTAGSMAYNFSLPDESGRQVSLNDFRGKVVFVDFWYSACGPCQKYYLDVLKPTHERFQKFDDVVFISICCDRYDVFKKAMLNGNFTSPDVINLYTDNKGFDHDVLKDYGIVSFPFPLLIGKDGTLLETGVSLRTKNSLSRSIESARSHRTEVIEWKKGTQN